jgi:hypothetical protein
MGLVVFLFVFALLGTYSPESKAQTPGPCPTGSELYGWGWSDTIGWISFNSKNPLSNGGTYCVSIDGSSNLVGWAWSDNIGWLKFGGLSGAPESGGDARLSNGQFRGFARACAGTVKTGDPYLTDIQNQNQSLATGTVEYVEATTYRPIYTGDCSTMTSRPDGWDGWLQLDGVTWSGTQSDGYAWGGEVVGWVDLDLKAEPTSPAASCTFGTPTNTSGNNYTITWGSTGASTCAAKIAEGFTSFTVGSPSTSGTASVEVPDNSSRIYGLECQPAAPATVAGSCQVTISNGDTTTPPPCPPNCPPPPGEADLPMWLTSADNTEASVINIKTGQSAEINWRASANDATFSQCTGHLDDITTLPGTQKEGYDSEFYGTVDETTDSFTTDEFTSPGFYRYSMTCVSDVDEDIVPAEAPSGAEYLFIRISESTLEEI